MFHLWDSLDADKMSDYLPTTISKIMRGCPRWLVAVWVLVCLLWWVVLTLYSIMALTMFDLWAALLLRTFAAGFAMTVVCVTVSNLKG